MTYDEGYVAGYRHGPYGVTPDGDWAGGYDADRMASDAYRSGLSAGRARRIEDMGDDALDAEARNGEASDAYRRAHPDDDGGSGSAIELGRWF